MEYSYLTLMLLHLIPNNGISQTTYHCIDDNFVITINGIFLININVIVFNSQ